MREERSGGDRDDAECEAPAGANVFQVVTLARRLM